METNMKQPKLKITPRLTLHQKRDFDVLFKDECKQTVMERLIVKFLKDAENKTAIQILGEFLPFRDSRKKRLDDSDLARGKYVKCSVRLDPDTYNRFLSKCAEIDKNPCDTLRILIKMECKKVKESGKVEYQEMFNI